MFIEKLTSLNRSVLGWAWKHIEENGAVDLTPVFDVSARIQIVHQFEKEQDYAKHLRELKHKYSLEVKSISSKSEVKPTVQPVPVFSATTKPTFTFGTTSTTTAPLSSAVFAFGTANTGAQPLLTLSHSLFS
jgi:hypothetical protein